ncbi:MAG: hypothetical protein U1F54_11360 [Burkholderiales bacterium]
MSRTFRNLAASSMLATTTFACLAATAPFDYGVLLSVGAQGSGSKAITTLGTVSIAGSVGNAVASAGTAPAPFTSATVGSTAPPNADPNAEVASTGQFGYSFVIVGPANSAVPLWVTASGFVSRSGASSDAGLHDASHAYLKITPQFFPSALAVEICVGSGFTVTVPGATCNTGSTSDSFALSARKITVPANTVIFVDMLAGAKAFRGGNASASVDPFIQVDPTFANAGQYSLVFSNGITQQPPEVTSTVVEYYNAALDHYFITWLPAEIAILDAGTQIKGWARTGYTFKTYRTAQTGASPVCRYYIPPALGNSHFFGRGTVECSATGQSNPTFVLEDPAFMQMFLPAAGACPQNTTQVYRVFSNRPDANHRYMTDKTVRTQMVTKGWLAEGDGPDLVVMCAPQ